MTTLGMDRMLDCGERLGSSGLATKFPTVASNNRSTQSCGMLYELTMIFLSVKGKELYLSTDL
jgi:hypothetical protein